MRPPTLYCFTCPNCLSSNQLSYRGSGNSFDSKLYSDGKMTGPMMPDDETKVGKCTECKTVSWIDGNLAESDQFYHPSVKISKKPRLYDYLKLLKASPFLNTEQEFYIRHKIYWLFNDRIRKGKNLFAFKNDEALFFENVNSLIQLITNATKSELDSFNLDGNEFLLLAELYRNKGDFDKAKQLMEENSVSAGLIYQNFMEACKNQYPFVIQVAKDIIFE
jgi:hypothetical protein